MSKKLHVKSFLALGSVNSARKSIQSILSSKNCICVFMHFGCIYCRILLNHYIKSIQPLLHFSAAFFFIISNRYFSTRENLKFVYRANNAAYYI
ncbi:hypothetical protein V8B55DRAFT_1037214 [Mucor lusitanicus]